MLQSTSASSTEAPPWARHPGDRTCTSRGRKRSLGLCPRALAPRSDAARRPAWCPPAFHRDARPPLLKEGPPGRRLVLRASLERELGVARVLPPDPRPLPV